GRNRWSDNRRWLHRRRWSGCYARFAACLHRSWRAGAGRRPKTHWRSFIMNPDVAILIVTYNSAGQIRECLDSILAQQERVSQEIIIVDNESTDDTVTLIRREFPTVKLILPGKNLGFAAGVNL